MIENLNRTDLAEEIRQNIKKEYEKIALLEYKKGNVKTIFVEILEDKNPFFKDKKKGKYITLEFPFPFSLDDEKIIKEEIKKALKKLIKEEKNITVAGIGNREITADALGPLTAEKIIQTRQIKEKINKKITVIKTEVKGKTGISAEEYISAITEKVEAEAVIVIDSLAAKSTKRLLKTIQITDTGILPGSATGNPSGEINAENEGIKVIAIGVPTVVDASTLVFELTSKEEMAQKGMIVTQANCDIGIKKLSETISSSINEFIFNL